MTTKAGVWFSEFLLVEKLENSKKVGKLGKKLEKFNNNGKLCEVEEFD